MVGFTRYQIELVVEVKLSLVIAAAKSAVPNFTDWIVAPVPVSSVIATTRSLLDPEPTVWLHVHGSQFDWSISVTTVSLSAIAAYVTLTWVKNDAAARNSAMAYTSAHAFIGTRGNVTVLPTTTGLRSAWETAPRRGCVLRRICVSRYRSFFGCSIPSHIRAMSIPESAF